MAKDKAADEFVSLHTHSDMSQLDGCGKIEEYVELAAEREHKAIAFTEHGTMRGFHQLATEAAKTDVKPIFGVELYTCPDMERKGLSDEEKDAATAGMTKADGKARLKELTAERKTRYHTTVWAKDDVGLRNLFKLSTLSWTDGFYYRPRVDIETLLDHCEGLVVGTACVGGPYYTLRREGHDKAAFKLSDKIFDALGSDYCIEIMPHDLDIQRETNQHALELWKRYDKKAKLIATQDAHYVDVSDQEHHEVMLAIGTRSLWDDPERWRFPGGGYHFRTRREMEDAFHRAHPYIDALDVDAALDNTLSIADRLNAKVTIDKFKCLLPPVDVPTEHADEYAFLKALCVQGWKWRGIKSRSGRLAERRGIGAKAQYREYVERLKSELRTINESKFTNYFLIVRDLYRWVRENEIACGPGRGSAAGCLVAYLLGITAVDPIKHGLMFERFISPGRLDMPDIDCDFEDTRRQEIIQHLRDKYGHDKVAQIATIGKMTAKQVIKDVARVFGVSFAESNQVTGAMPEDFEDLEDAFSRSKFCSDFARRHPEVLHHAKRLEGMAKNLGVHAAGVVTSPVPLVDIIPLETRDHSSGTPIAVTAVDMYGAQDMGLLKLDVLGLRTMSVLSDTVKAVSERHGVDIDLETMDLEDPDVLKGFTQQDFIGVFQFDTHSAEKLTESVTFEEFSDIVIMTAMNRPGTINSGLVDIYLRRRDDPSLRAASEFHPKVDAATDDSLGVMVYQEHVIKVLGSVAGFNPGEADKVRKAIGKKLPDEIAEFKDKFLDGAAKTTKDMSATDAETLWRMIEEFAGYGFNKSHATAYSVIAYWCMALKRRYPIEFFWALLSHQSVHEKIQQVSRAAKTRGIEVLPAHVSKSKVGFSIDDDEHAIRGSLVDLKGVGEKAAEAIMEGQPYDGFPDFLDRAVGRVVNKRVVKVCVLAGALDGIVPGARWFIDNLDEFWKAVTSKSKKRDERVAKMLEAAPGWPEYTDDERFLVAQDVTPLAFGKHPLDIYQPFLDSKVRVPHEDPSAVDFMDRNDGRHVYVFGVVTKAKDGTFEAFGKDADAFGRYRRYANLYIEGFEGRRRRLNMDWNMLSDFESVIKEGEGTPVIAHVKPSAHYDSCKAQFVVSVRRLKRRLDDKHELNIWERIVLGRHPVTTYRWKSKHTRRVHMRNIRKRLPEYTNVRFRVTGVVTDLKLKIDKRGREMSFFGLTGYRGYIEFVCFGTAWPEFKKAIANGNLVTVEGSRNERGAILDWDGHVWLLEEGR